MVQPPLEYKILLFLAETIDAKSSRAHLAHHLAVDPVIVGHRLDWLRKNGFIRRSGQMLFQNRHRAGLRITDKGLQWAREIRS